MTLFIFVWDSVPEARAAGPTETADDVLSFMRLHIGSQSLSFSGFIRGSESDKRDVFKVQSGQGILKIQFVAPFGIVQADYNRPTVSLKVFKAGHFLDVPPSEFSNPFRNSSLNLADICMFFLAWEKSEILTEQAERGFKCWVIRLSDSKAPPPYNTVDIWVPKMMGGFVRMDAYNSKSKLVKRILLLKYGKLGSGMVPQSIRVEAFDPKSGKISSRSYVSLQPD